MTTLKSRLERLEKKQPTDNWLVPMIRTDEYPGDLLEKKLAELEHQALAAGWRPGHGVYVVIIHMSEDEDNPEAET